MRFQDVVQARNIISGIVHQTPVFTSSYFDELCGRKLFFKCELFQKTGSFKARGALNAVLTLKNSKKDRFKGVVTHSSGNHGQALAWAAGVAKVPCTVVVPRNASMGKVKAIKGYGAELVFCEPNPTARITTCSNIATEKGYEIIPPYDHPLVMAGQGTIGLELLDQIPDLDAVLIPVSGGGMSSGIAVAVKSLKPDVKVFLVEPKGKNLEPCLRSGEKLWPDPPQFVDTLADGLRIQKLGELTFPLICELCEKDVFTVGDTEIVASMKMVFERMKLVVEPSSAIAVGAVLSDKMRSIDPSVKNVAVILCGGNVDIDNLPW